MAQQKTAQDRRAQSRERRRAAAQTDPPDVDAAVDAVVGGSGEHQSPGDALRTAASAALAAAAVGAARAIAQRRMESHPETEHDAEPEEQEPEAPQNADDTPEPASTTEEREPQEAPAEAHEDEDVDDEEPREAAPPGRARAVIEAAKTHLRELRGADAEAVSSVRRTRDGWRVALDVVEVHRIPDSTDVLGTYELELDDDGELITLERTGRFYRSEAERR